MGGGDGGVGSALARPGAPANTAKPIAAADALVTINLLMFMRCPFRIGVPDPTYAGGNSGQVSAV
ncbi:hypothetical protein DE4585_03016 [Mycobacteroides salmoniphilum]|uniref:Uncharacterized protein n=1 Tax=Mycobacteroides salmoniphilum TaxID=404941 RepID=A0A4R8RXU4_9MYCO|nr:hypothetical protein DE4585_03016 [Mycobacteroides salmoniphilum]TDZ81352.1 hypothetical protein DE4586_01300 [Mycobacteroides salmoniphilum]TDZ88852.1 hypothetical protein DE4587_01216 [Mycobacteroides salmoniphilum]